MRNPNPATPFNEFNRQLANRFNSFLRSPDKWMTENPDALEKIITEELKVIGGPDNE